MKSEMVNIMWGNDHELAVECDVSPYRPARTNCLPENAYPAEGGLEGITKIVLVKHFTKGNTRKSITRELPQRLQVQLCDDREFMASVEYALEEKSRDDAEYAAELRAERRMEARRDYDRQDF